MVTMSGSRCFQYVVAMAAIGLFAWISMLGVGTNEDSVTLRRNTQETVGCGNSGTGRTCFSCPDGEGSSSFESDGVLDFAISDHDRLCTLVQLAPDGKSFKPVARSYDAYDWEPAAGDFDTVEFACTDEVCSVELPALQVGAKYQLNSFEVPKQYSGESDTIARFLEQATFGATRDDIASFKRDDSTLAFAKWIEDQQSICAQSLPMTSHRAVFRQHLNPFSSVATSQGQVSHPCQKGARYRRYAFNNKDDGSFVTVQSIGGTNKKALKVNGFVRTVVNGPIHKHGNTGLVFGDGDYKTTWLNNRMNVLGGDIWFVHATSGITQISFNGTLGNPPIRFDSGVEPNILLDIPPNGASFIDLFYFQTKQELEQEIILTEDISSSTCDSLGEPGNPLNPVYALYKGKYWIHDPRYIILDNTVDSPASDGGGKVARDTINNINEKYAAVCSNAPRNFLNEDDCVWSNKTTACSVGRRQFSYQAMDKVSTTDANGVLVCGSPDEISNDPFLGGNQGRGSFDSYVNPLISTSVEDFSRQKKTIWTKIALTAKDQLRQRVAWALSQILVMTDTGDSMTEFLVAYYDIFVRNAFGNYRQILKEVAYNPLMGKMLTYFMSKSMSFTFEMWGKLLYADENFAREVMQLFTTGLYLLNTDGTKILDDSGEPLLVYTNDDIMEYARVWTGLDPQPLRGNTEMVFNNPLDPMMINIATRDPLPKMGLNQKYIGDHVPLCIDLPKQHFLKQGATYRLLGKTGSPELQTPDPKSWESDSNVKRVTLQPTGMLHAALCGSTNPSHCKYAAKVVLEKDISCSGQECIVDTLRTVEVANGMFYEYIRPPCVYQAFFNDAKMVLHRTYWHKVTCADPRTVIASAACCRSNGGQHEWIDEYWGETINFATAQARCNGDVKCSRWPRPDCSQKGTYCDNQGILWTNDPCKVKVKINFDGKVALVHSPNNVEISSVSATVRTTSKTYFRVDWSGGDENSIITDCTSHPSCSSTPDDQCICDVTVVDEQVYFDGDSPTAKDVLEKLQIGAFDPRLTGIGASSGWNDEVVWYNPSGQLSSDSVFEVTDENGIRQWRKNMKSTVTIDGTMLSFRNPVHFISVTTPETRDANFETDSAIDHYIYHPNTAPFIAIRLAQRFGISNPSPRFVEAIATTFRAGSYTYESTTFGTGNYGDLAATIACVLLDREARTVLLDADPSHGSLREPLIKLIGLMRSMEFKLNDDAPFVDFDSKLSIKLGQMAHAQPNVFSYFLPEYKPSGPVGHASLTAPEASALSGPRIVETLNGLASLVKYGLSRCWGGFSVNYAWDYSSCDPVRWGKKNQGTLGALTYEPTDSSTAESITDELATLLTAGRLSVESREIIDRVVEDEPDAVLKVVKAQQLILYTPEFHSTNIVRKNGLTRPEPASQSAPSHPYKAVVYLMLEGGMDSFNMLAPHTCTATNPSGQTLLQQYYAERLNLAITSSERSRIINAANQPCSQFVIHKELEVVERLYKDGDLAFFANTGVLNMPVDKDSYSTLHKTTLFAHNAMREEAQRVDALIKAPGTGVLGRMCDTLSNAGFSAKPIAIENPSLATSGVAGKGMVPLVVSPFGTNGFNPKPPSETFDPRPFIDELNDSVELQSSLYGETWSGMLQTALNDNEALVDVVKNTPLQNTFPTTEYGDKMKIISTLIASNSRRGVDRDVFYAPLIGWDTHDKMKDTLNNNFKMLNAALSSFEKELKAKGLWKNVTLVLTSDFARTLTPNSGDGSDHAWGGHYFIMGGDVAGSRIHGEYPSDITSTGPLDVGRGRFIPTTSWESILNSVLQWMGVPDSKLDYCLPNRIQTGTKLYTKAEVFK